MSSMTKPPMSLEEGSLYSLESPSLFSTKQSLKPGPSILRLH